MGIVEYEEGSYSGVWIVEVERFLKIRASREPGLPPVNMRLAQCNFFQRRPSVDGMLVAKEGDIPDPSYFMLAEALGAKLVVCNRQQSQQGHKFYALRYSTMSRQQ